MSFYPEFQINALQYLHRNGIILGNISTYSMALGFKHNEVVIERFIIGNVFQIQ